MLAHIHRRRLTFTNIPRSLFMKQFDASKIADDLQGLIAHAEELLRATAGTAGEAASDARERAEESLSAVRERLASF